MEISKGGRVLSQCKTYAHIYGRRKKNATEPVLRCALFNNALLKKDAKVGRNIQQ